ncbi:MAG: pyridoxal phosphate-dependent aminotransferase [Phycisphaerales bacterium]|nr:MAG: pyridoxal phosphate-dependent aminotransferase [Phycisphaerales bacterium]
MTQPATPSRPEIDFNRLISQRAGAIDVSGIRRAFELGGQLDNPINLSIGQPDFPVPEAIKRSAIEAIEKNRNGYTLTRGAPELLDSVAGRLRTDVGWDLSSDGIMHMITSGTSGALLLAYLAVLNPGDEVIIPDPYFVVYPAIGEMVGAKTVYCETYPDFRMTAERIEALITDRTKMVLINSPGNPTGVVLSSQELQDILELCRKHGILLVSDEIYDAFTYEESLEDGRFPTPARFGQDMLLVRGFGKTYGCTGWRMGYAAGPSTLIQQMMKLQQYTFVCAPSMAQVGLAGAFEVDLGEHIRTYQSRRDRVAEAFGDVTDLVQPGGAFYAFVKVPARLGVSSEEFFMRAINRNVIVIPGHVFSRRDTHFRLSYATPDEQLDRGLAILRELMVG